MRQTEDAGRQSNVSQLCWELKQHKFKLINTLEIEGKEKSYFTYTNQNNDRLS